jgi:hypothetical protein
MNLDRSRRRLVKTIGMAGAVAFVSFSAVDTSRADSPPALSGFAPLGQVVLDKNGCTSCPAVFATARRHRAFALASDSPFPVHQIGRVDVACANGSDYHVFLQSTVRGGPFQLVPNLCVNLDSKEVKVTVTSVTLSPPDEDRTVALMTYGSVG